MSAVTSPTAGDNFANLLVSADVGFGLGPRASAAGALSSGIAAKQAEVVPDTKRDVVIPDSRHRAYVFAPNYR